MKDQHDDEILEGKFSISDMWDSMEAINKKRRALGYDNLVISKDLTISKEIDKYFDVQDVEFEMVSE